MDIQKTRQYNKTVDQSQLCDCDYCLNYIKQIKSEYPVVSEYLDSLGVDIAKPFETMPLEPDNQGKIEYTSVLYVVLGNKNQFKNTTFSNVRIEVTTSHPSTDIQDNHFVIEVYPIVLKWDI